MPPKSNTEPSAGAQMKRQYLISYNAISATLWFGVLARVVMHAAAEGVENGKVYEELERYTRLVQTGACLEVAHSLLVAWSVTEVIRYSYFVFALTDSVPKLWTWLRYNTFLVLYPIGVASETWLVYKAIPPASKIDEKFGWGLWAVLATYIPGFYTLFTYMLKQRRRIMRADAGKKKQ
ncbi:uncharacterized protein N0V89_004846 [Didymosphaeria variabile]|uniref:Very-long-chain (3R)-3-hydroxyacyl-CoA dehydratase n=1 Tax=Didymosphaeria variabile TaxID=1932322 RepID=A0A9W8XQM5_9PLEO|nr:uncharacterized protein N0V89_004846 [Didymosphaeria variabile]KAJ4356809.1 hypothetical protein N0V89_004846 [Didymosphaeria variabile]